MVPFGWCLVEKRQLSQPLMIKKERWDPPEICQKLTGTGNEAKGKTIEPSPLTGKKGGDLQEVVGRGLQTEKGQKERKGRPRLR